MLGDDSSLAPPESISNSEVKRTCADDSVGFPHVKVGYRQALFLSEPLLKLILLYKIHKTKYSKF